ncbi:MAG: transcriptional repressor LexA [Coriobacteriales bacterium]|jgi:repressor LexA|nr:transcriptional repressor LexA [Coriobacteriales bacterium]
MVRDAISKRQRQVLAYIALYTQTHGYPPSVRDIGEHVGLASPSTVFTHLTSLERKGYIRKEKDSARALIILPRGWQELDAQGALPETADGTHDSPDAPAAPYALIAGNAARQQSFGDTGSGNIIELPLIGRVAAGEPIYAHQNIEDSFALPKQLVGDRGSFMLTIKGDSMIEAGINDGDYVVVREQATADNGDIVVAMLGEDATVKTFYREKDCIRLHPQNSSMEPIYTRDVQIVGKVIALLRAM